MTKENRQSAGILLTAVGVFAVVVGMGLSLAWLAIPGGGVLVTGLIMAYDD